MMNIWNNAGKPVSKLQMIARVTLGMALMFAGTSHLTFARNSFQAQVPDWVPLSKDLTVILSGIVEIALGAALAFWVKNGYSGDGLHQYFLHLFSPEIFHNGLITAAHLDLTQILQGLCVFYFNLY